jgi:3-hydroxymyristoyl/3-hydroxydecanoyl-(acyl carrier protein) dehydratase
VADPSLSQLQPELLAERQAGSHYELDLRVPADLAVWPGHFPEFFLVPGVLQVDWVMRLARARFGLRAVPPRIEGLKFKTPLRPQQRFTMRLDVAADGRAIDFELASETEVYSRGRLHLDGASH